MVPAGADSPSHISFESLLSRVRELETHFGYLPDRYLQSPVGQIIMSSDSSVMMLGESIVDSVRSYRLRVCDPVSLTPGSSRDGDSVVPFLRSLFGLPVVVSLSGTVPSAVVSSGSGATVMGRDSLVVPGWGVSSVATSVTSGVAVGRLRGRPFLCLFYLFWGRLGGPFYCRFGFGGFAQQLPVYPVTSVAPSVPASLPFSMDSLLASSHHPTLPLAPVSSATLASSQPLGPVGSVSLGSGDGAAEGSVVPGAMGVVVAAASLGGRLPESDQAGVYVDTLNFPEGEETDASTRFETTGAFCQVLSFIASFFPDPLPSKSQPPNIASWFHGFGDDRKKEPRVYLFCFDKIKELMVEINRKVTATAKDQRRSVQDGVKSVGTSVYQELRLDDLHRSQGLVPSGSDSPGQQEVFEICSRRQSISVQGALLWPLHCPSSIHKGHGSGVIVSPQYLDDWLILASSHLEARDKVLRMCSLLGIVVNLEKSSLVPSQTTSSFGVVLVGLSLRAFPTPKRIETVREQITRFLSSRRQSVVSWVA